MKKKILFLCVEEHMHEQLLSCELKMLSEIYDIVFASCLEDALDEIAKAKLIDGNPIHGLVFNRNTLVVYNERCGLVKKFAEKYATSSIVAINMIYNDQDSEARDCAVSDTYCKHNNWHYVKTIFDNHFEK